MRETTIYLNPLLGQFAFTNTVTPTEEAHATASLLLDKARHLGLSLPLDLERLAVARGCSEGTPLERHVIHETYILWKH